MLHLASTTRATWLPEALADLDAILLDHAHCEKKAAGAALKLLFSYPQYATIQAPISALAREELAHFEAVLERLAARGVPFARQHPSAYAGRLHTLVRRDEPDRLLDTLLVSSLIEARSCERFGLLADALETGAERSEPDRALGGFYRDLLASEARHHGIYVDLAAELRSEAAVLERIAELALAETEILRKPGRPTRLHS